MCQQCLNINTYHGFILKEIEAAWAEMEKQIYCVYCPNCLKSFPTRRQTLYSHSFTPTRVIYYCYSCRSSYLFNELELE